ncbi:hypothetical protein CRG98_026279 [Punica granatum]|uniref:Uncharacterized protein n=1 Tax=Punica granatum TaxID=22663 RepID=A0A2I0JAR4_PUNGR|nr:hypothetical protein CRG98_026279 [Punica granatum]
MSIEKERETHVYMAKLTEQAKHYDAFDVLDLWAGELEEQFRLHFSMAERLRWCLVS